jgi:hypothetical protein
VSPRNAGHRARRIDTKPSRGGYYSRAKCAATVRRLPSACVRFRACEEQPSANGVLDQRQCLLCFAGIGLGRLRTRVDCRQLILLSFEALLGLVKSSRSVS